MDIETARTIAHEQKAARVCRGQPVSRVLISQQLHDEAAAWLRSDLGRYIFGPSSTVAEFFDDLAPVICPDCDVYVPVDGLRY